MRGEEAKRSDDAAQPEESLRLVPAEQQGSAAPKDQGLRRPRSRPPSRRRPGVSRRAGRASA